jgi:hypothetical protein
VVALSSAALLAGCQTQRAAEKDRTEELERRVAELEAQLSPSPSPEMVAPEMAVPAPEPAAPAIVESRPAPARPARASRSAQASRPAPSRRAEPAPAADPQPVVEPAPRVEPARPAPVEPAVESLRLPQGTELKLRLETPLSSATSREGDAVTARVENATDDEGRVALPGGTVLKGRVVEVRRAGRVKGRALISVDFDRIVVRGRTSELEASPISVEAPDDHGRDAKIVGGAAAAGAVIGAIKDGKEGFAKGAILGGAAGTGAVLVTRGRDIEIPAGSQWTVRLKDAVRL